jgi:hypothetical protein
MNFIRELLKPNNKCKYYFCWQGRFPWTIFIRDVEQRRRTPGIENLQAHEESNNLAAIAPQRRRVELEEKNQTEYLLDIRYTLSLRTTASCLLPKIIFSPLKPPTFSVTVVDSFLCLPTYCCYCKNWAGYGSNWMSVSLPSGLHWNGPCAHK